MLKNMKFRVKDEEHSKSIQDALFAAGYTWAPGEAEHMYTDAPYLFANVDGYITFLHDDPEYFDNHEYQEYVLLDYEFVLASEVADVAADKPPMGLRPRYIVAQERAIEIVEAMDRYVRAGKKLPTEWLTELIDVNRELGGK